MSKLEIGRLLRGDNSGFVVGCRVAQSTSPTFGSLVKAPQEGDYAIYGLVHQIRIEDDGLVRQLVTAEGLDENVIADNRLNRNVPLEMSVIAVGFSLEGRLSYLLPPRPPLSLDVITLCEADEVRQFTSGATYGYLRHILRQEDLPVGELLAAHIQQASAAHLSAGNADWQQAAMQEVIKLLRDDHPRLMQVMGALGEI